MRISANVSERAKEPPNIGVSVVILALGPSDMDAHGSLSAPRSHGGLPMVSIVYWALIGETEAKDFHEAQNVRWFPVNQLPPLAFDHKDIIDYALTRVRNKIEYSDIATRLVGSEFTLSQLRNVYEAIYGRKLDPPNFRRRMLSTGMVEPTGEKLARGAHRPASLYRYAAHPGTSKPQNATARQ